MYMLQEPTVDLSFVLGIGSSVPSDLLLLGQQTSVSELFSFFDRPTT